MSNLADKTEYRALWIMAKMVREFEQLHFLEMTKSDDWDAIQTRNLLQGIVESNGYRINYDCNRKRPLFKKGTQWIH